MSALFSRDFLYAYPACRINSVVQPEGPPLAICVKCRLSTEFVSGGEEIATVLSAFYATLMRVDKLCAKEEVRLFGATAQWAPSALILFTALFAPFIC